MQLLLISEKTKNNDQHIGDIIGIFPDSHIFSEHEHEIFNIIHVDLTKEEIEAKRPEMRPIVEEPKIIPELTLEEAIENGNTEESLLLQNPDQDLRKPTLALVTKNELDEEVLIPITDAIKPRFELHYENGEIVSNYKV